MTDVRDHLVWLAGERDRIAGERKRWRQMAAEDIAAALADDVPVAEIARLLGVTRQTVYTLLDATEVTSSPTC